MVNGALTDIQTVSYNSLGQVKQQTVLGDSANVTTSFTYDAIGRLTKTINGDVLSDSPRNYAVQSYIDGHTPVVIATDFNGHTVTQQYDRGHRLVSTTQTVSHLFYPGCDLDEPYVTTLTYDLLDRVLTTQDPLGQVTGYEYGTRGWVEKIDIPGNSFTDIEYVYDVSVR